MQEMSKLRQSMGYVLIAALVVSLGVQCVVGQEMTTTEMACCATADHDCHSTSADCCQSERRDQKQLAQKVQPLVSSLELVSSAITTVVPPACASDGSVLDATDLMAGSPAKYVLLHSLLI